jgi:hypothetical protein
MHAAAHTSGTSRGTQSTLDHQLSHIVATLIPRRPRHVCSCMSLPDFSLGCSSQTRVVFLAADYPLSAHRDGCAFTSMEFTSRCIRCRKCIAMLFSLVLDRWSSDAIHIQRRCSGAVRIVGDWICVFAAIIQSRHLSAVQMFSQISRRRHTI